MKEERFPHTKKPLHWWRRGVGVGQGGSFRATEESTETGAEGKVERFPYRGLVPTSTHQPERLVCSPAWAGGARSCGSGFGGQTPGKGLGLAA